MARVFYSRYQPGLKPGDGANIDWQVGERTEVISGPDKGRFFIVKSSWVRHPDVPWEYVREGYFEDDPAKTLYAKPESALWLAGQHAQSES